MTGQHKRMCAPQAIPRGTTAFHNTLPGIIFCTRSVRTTYGKIRLLLRVLFAKMVSKFGLTGVLSVTLLVYLNRLCKYMQDTYRASPHL